LYYLSAYTLGCLPVLALHKNYEQSMSKKDFSKIALLLRMAVLNIYSIVICVIFAIYDFSLVFSVFCILGLGICHGALLGGLSQFASVFPSPCYGYLILGVDLAGVVPFLITILLTLAPTNNLLFHFLYLTPAALSLLGLISLGLLLQSGMAKECLGQSTTVLRNNAEGMESLLRSGDEADDGGYVSLSSFVSHYPTPYKAALAWGVLVFACTLCTYFMVPFFPQARKTSSHLPAYLFFAQHFADVFGREVMCGIVKNAVKGKVFMWVLVILRALIISGFLAELLTWPISGALIGALEVGAVVLSGLVGGAVNPSVYTLAGLRISDDTRNSSRAIYVCMWCSVAGALTALALLNGVSFVRPNLHWSTTTSL